MSKQMTTNDSTDTSDIEYDPERDAYRATYDWAGSEPLRIFVARVVATAAGVSPTELEAIYRSVNPEALDEVFEPLPDGTARTGGGIWFSVDDYDVVIHGDGEVVVTSRRTD